MIIRAFRHMVFLMLLLNACTTMPQHSPCPANAGHPSLLFSLYFGRDIPGRGSLTEQEWMTFVDTIITRTLPDGYTIFDAEGAWLNPTSRRTVHDATKVLQVALPGSSDSIKKIELIRSSYQEQFHQQLVGLAIQPTCTAF